MLCPPTFLRFSHNFQTFSSQKQGAYEHAAAGGRMCMFEVGVVDGNGADDVGRTGDLLPPDPAAVPRLGDFCATEDAIALLGQEIVDVD
jgi:hypothetical protein